VAAAVPYRWATKGDINAFFGLMLDNIANMVLLVSLLEAGFGLPASFSLRYMIPGTALGVVVGDLAFTAMAFQLARRTGAAGVTAMPLGLDTPSTFGMVFFVLGPAFQLGRERGLDVTGAATAAWHIGIWSLVFSGLFKLACAPLSGWVRRSLPRAGLLGSLAAIALVLISFLPLLDILHDPIVGLVGLTLILTTLVARVELPLRVPGALAALLVGSGLYYLIHGIATPLPIEAALPTAGAAGAMGHAWFPTEWLAAWRFEWLPAASDAIGYLPVVIPFALATVVGGIDCTESAAAAGDEFDTNRVIAVEAVATLVAAVSGGVIQTTPFIGHPAYKAMGGRAGYTLATALVVGTAGIIGYFSTLYAVLPLAAVFPILVFIGLEITAQSFAATDARHYPAVAVACLPALAYLAMMFVDKLLAYANLEPAGLTGPLGEQIATLRILSGGFIVTSLLWASALAALVDRRLARAATYLAVAAGASLIGVIHSPHVGSPIGLPWRLPLPPAGAPTPYVLALGYLLAAGLLWCWSWWDRGVSPPDAQPGEK
jgi:AGZA family xanthine/uracil permease-like MFS transporter